MLFQCQRSDQCSWLPANSTSRSAVGSPGPYCWVHKGPSVHTDGLCKVRDPCKVREDRHLTLPAAHVLLLQSQGAASAQTRATHLKICSYSAADRSQDRSRVMPFFMSACTKGVHPQHPLLESSLLQAA